MTHKPEQEHVTATVWWEELPAPQRDFWQRRAGSTETSQAWTAFQRALANPIDWLSLNVTGLDEAIATAIPSATHSALTKAIGQLPTLEGVQLALVKGGRGVMSLSKRKVVNGTGEVIAENHKQWLEQQVRIDSGNVQDAFQRLKQQDLYLTCCHLTNLVFVVDRGGPDQSNFSQIEVQLEDEWIDRRLFPSSSFYRPTDLADLTDPWEIEPLDAKQAAQLRPPTYRLNRTVHISDFIALASAKDALDRAKFRQKTFVRSHSGQPGAVVTSTEAFPGWDAAPTRATRLFDDWQRSSAGRSGARLCDHWVLELSIYKRMAAALFDVGYVPAWTTKLKLAKVSRTPSIYTLYGDLQKLDRRVGVPFAWYFFMLHGNRVGDWVAEAVIAGAEAGEIVLPEHDYQVLKSWQSHTYGF